MTTAISDIRVRGVLHKIMASYDKDGNSISDTYAKVESIPTMLSQLENDSGYLKNNDVQEIIQTKVDKIDGYSLISNGDLEKLQYLDKTKDIEKPISISMQDALDLKANIDNIPTKVSELLNDSNYLTEVPEEYVTTSEMSAFIVGSLSNFYTKNESDSKYIQDISMKADNSTVDSHISNTSNPHNVTKVQLGLGNVTDDAQVKRTELGVTVATLEDGKVPSSQLPSYVDDVLEYESITLFPEIGEGGKIYISTNDNLSYRWTGTQYIEISKSLALGETSSTAYAGDKGKQLSELLSSEVTRATEAEQSISTTLSNHTSNISNPHHVTKEQVGLGNVDNTSDINKPISALTQSALDNKVDKIEGKSLVLDSEIEKLSGLSTQSNIDSSISIAKQSGDNAQSSINLHINDITNPHSVTKAQVGLDNVDNTSDLSKPISTATQEALDTKVNKVIGKQLSTEDFTTAEKNKLSSIEDSANNYIHPTTTGNKHIPTNGSDGQLLSYLEDGTAQWSDSTSKLDAKFTELNTRWEELNTIQQKLNQQVQKLYNIIDLYSYGVSINPNVADPDLTRIGNLTLHKTLPIQEGIKGCIAQCKTVDGKPKIVYWLNKYDWRFKETPDMLYGQTLNVADGVYTITNSVFSTNRYLKQYVKIDNIVAQITAIDIDSATATLVPESTIAAGTYNVELGSVLSGYDGEVKNYVPKFYYRSWDNTNEQQVRISQVQIDSTWIEFPEILISPWGVCLLRTVPENMGYLSTLSANSAVSIVNDNIYCRGGDNSSTYDSATDVYRRNLNKPSTNISRGSMRTYTSNSGNNILSYNEYKVLYWLWVIEFGTFNSQKGMNAASELQEPDLTGEGYHTGGLGDGVTTINGNYWGYYNSYCPLTPCGYLAQMGNRTGYRLLTVVTPTASGGEQTQPYTFKVPSWRGFENIFGDYWKNVDGIIVDANSTAEGRNGMDIVYTADSNYSDSITSDYSIAGYTPHKDGYIKKWNVGTKAEIIPIVVGGSASTYICDYRWGGSSDTTLRTLILGSYAADGSQAGVGSFDSSKPVTRSPAYFGFWASSRL